MDKLKERFKRLIEYIQKLPIAFNIKGIETFSQNGITTETLVLQYDNAEFVFVEGKDDVLLGWDYEKDQLGENVLKEFERDYWEGIEYYKQEYSEIKEDYESQIESAKSEEDKESLIQEMEESLEYIKEKIEISWEEHKALLYKQIAEHTSVLRKSNICPMIVERDSQYIEEDLSYEAFKELKGLIVQEPFSIPTEDEWEYLCGGGSRTFFRWGDSLDIYAIYDEKKNVFYDYNMFGIHIAYNPYRYELIESSTVVKGGDGGGSICGGDGALYVAPCFSSFYREKIHAYDDRMSKNFYTYRRIIRMKDFSTL